MANEFRVKNGIITGGSIVPDADDSYDLGSASAAFQDLFLEGDVTLTDAGSIKTSAGDLTLDSAGDVVIDADGADVILKDDGTEFGRFKRDSSDFVIKSATNNKDIIFKGQDGGSTITALTLDMSEAGTALFGHDVTLLNDAAVLGFGADTDVTLTHVADTGLLLNDAMQLQFRDDGLKIHSTANGQLDIDADATIDIASAVTALSGTTGIAIVSPSIVLGNTTSASTVVEIKDEVNDANSAELKFVKDKGAAGADGDDIGKITFVGDDAAQAQTSFGQILVEISEADNTDEAGKMSLLVAESDGTTTALTAGLVLEGEHATDGEVDVTIAAGTGSTTTVAGNLTVNGNFLPGTDDSHDIGSASAAFQDLFLEGDITLTDAGSIKTSAGDFTVDSAADIILDAAGKDIAFRDDGNTRFRFDLETAPIQTVTGNFTIDCSGTITLDGGTSDGILFEEAGTEFAKFAKESDGSVSVSAATTTGTNQAGNNILLMGGNATGNGLPGSILFQLHEKSGSSGSSSTGLGTGEATAMSISNGGSVTVGINNNSPAALGNGGTATSVLDIRGPVGQPGVLTLSTKETTLVDGDMVGKIEFFAPLASAGGDATLLLAAIEARSNATHSSTVNTTDLIFHTATDAAATEAMRIKGDKTITTQSDLTVGGNLIVSGTTTTVNTATLSVEDPLIIMANGNNSGDAVDIGFYGLYDSSGSQDLYAGLFRDASDSGKFKLFKDLQTEPNTTVDPGGAGYAVATLVADIEGSVTGDITGNVSGSAATVTGAAQSAITSLGTLTALTGGTGDLIWDTPTFVVDSSADSVGIGTTSPLSKLHIEKTAYDFDSSPEDGDFHLFLKATESSTAGDALSIGFAQSSDGTTVGAKVSHLIENSYSRGSLVFSTNNTASAGDNTAERMRITAAGNVGIGVTDPSSILQVKEASTINSIANSARMVVAANGGDSYIHLMESTDGHNIRHTASDNSLRFRSTLAGSDLMSLTSGGNLGIGYTSPSEKLEVAGSILIDYALAHKGDSNNSIVFTTDTQTFNTDGTARLTIASSGAVTVAGAFSAATKSFDIEHPTKEGKRLHHGSLEGPEHGVYHRGISNSRVVDLPDYWTGLVDEDSITVQITPKGQFQSLYVSKIEGNRVYVDSDHGEPLDFYFNVYGERKDVDKLVVEY